ncbi:putative uncharacterized protein DDB_G0282133 isoform X2 [Leptopilina heterotoma]|uniref:putative uncharacterized protein DDB_G0282133 isoform X2 n=1 Tax=Leptopilina heterotoma TaxID=63436 RepID=UPI001CAA3248|nr:putative uncharacterized protein DDB_G0282133 isoform X2 [Leptopilina heterotoma]
MPFTRMSFKTAFLLCVVLTLVPVHGGKKVSDEEESPKLPEFLSELDLASIEASEEDIKDLKKVVKRLAPEKNGEYQIYQGVTGQPGVDFPVLTTIPTTSFTCRGVKGGYYADLETNCQVFHICDNGRKISFLCPNGTIFQQSQLICDWWFKVDCSRSTELYEQSAELLAEEERKRNDAKKISSEYHRTSEEENGQNNFQYVDYDGRQNGRSNPFSQTANQNQIQDNQNNKNQPYRQNLDYNKGSSRQNQFAQDYKPKDLQDLSEGNTNFNQQKQSTVFPNNHQSRHRQQNQLTDDRKEKSKQYNDYDNRGGRKYQLSDQGQGKTEKQVSRNSKSKSFTDTNYNGITQKATPSYTETTTFRTTSPNPIREYQQMAESAAFVNNRGNRFNKVYSTSQYNNYQNNRATSSDTQKSTTPNENNSPTTTKPKVGSIPPFPGPTFTPIFKPRLTSSDKRGPTTTPRSQTTTDGFAYNNKNAQNYKQIANDDRYRTSTQKTYVNTDYYKQNPTTVVPTTIYDSTYSNYYDNPTTGNYQEEFTTLRPVENYRQNSATATGTYQNSATGTYQTSGTGTHQNSGTGTYQNSATGTYQNNYKSEAYQNSPTGTNQATEAYRQNSSGITYVDNTVTPSATVLNKQPQGFEISKNYQNGERNDIQYSTKNPSRSSQIYQLNSIVNAATEKSFNENSVTNKPDLSLSNRQGKASTSRPYVPFTKNYAYTTVASATTQKPTIYTATVPPNNRGSFNDLVPNSKSNSASFSPSRSGTGATYLPKQTTSVTSKPILDDRPKNEKEHVLNMIQSLQGLEGTNSDIPNGNRSGLNIPSSSGPSTLHSLALYFATAADNSGLANITESSQNLEYKTEVATKNGNKSVELPTSILTQHTINSYIDLFNLNNALENNTAILLEDTSGELNSSNDFEDDLDIQQSEGPLNAAKKSNSTKLRELAQVFTHALSAYLQDPETFKKVLTEIRPTEPSLSTEDENAENTLSPTTTEEYPSVTKEKDEVLDFSDDSNTARRRRPTTPYPNQPTNYIAESNQEGSTDYYTTSVTSSNSQYSTTQLPDVNNRAGNDNFAYQVNSVLQENRNSIIPSNSLNDYENYFPETNKASYQNNTREPYGKNLKPFDAIPITNYVPTTTPSSFFQTEEQRGFYDQNRPEQELTPPALPTSQSPYQNKNSNYRTENQRENSIPSTTEPFRIRYYDTPNLKNHETLVTATNVHSSYRNELDNRLRATGRSNSVFNTKDTRPYTTTTSPVETPNDHWTSSPEVTRLWETTVFLDPQRINHDLIHDQLSTSGPRLADPTQFNTNPSQELLATDASNSVTPQNFITDSSTPWQWSPNDNDSPTTFTLLPSAYSTENTATPNPIYTTITSVTSSVTSTNPGTQETHIPNSRISDSVINITENEIEKAQEMFGKLNSSSSNTLMKVMKQADNNATVRQLVLLLISHCNGPMNKTMEEEKEHLLNALLKLPVNEFTSEESREIIAGIGRLNLPLGNNDDNLKSDKSRVIQTFIAVTEPSITTFRNRQGRKFKSTTPVPDTEYHSSSNPAIAESRSALVEDETSLSDSRALELLRSLYSIAAKWG